MTFCLVACVLSMKMFYKEATHLCDRSQLATGIF